MKKKLQNRWIQCWVTLALVFSGYGLILFENQQANWYSTFMQVGYILITLAAMVLVMLQTFSEANKSASKQIEVYKDESFKQILAISDSTNKQIDGIKDSTNQQISSFKELTEKQIASNQKESEKQINVIEESTKAQIGELQKVNNSQLLSMQKQTQDQINAIHLSTEKYVSTLKSESERQIKTLEESTKVQISEFQKVNVKQIDAMQINTEKQVYAIKNATQEQIKSLNDVTQKQIAANQKETEKQIAELTNSTEKQINSFVEQTNEIVDRLEKLGKSMLDLTALNKEMLENERELRELEIEKSRQREKELRASYIDKFESVERIRPNLHFRTEVDSYLIFFNYIYVYLYNTGGEASSVVFNISLKKSLTNESTKVESKTFHNVGGMKQVSFRYLRAKNYSDYDQIVVETSVRDIQQREYHGHWVFERNDNVWMQIETNEKNLIGSGTNLFLKQ